MAAAEVDKYRVLVPHLLDIPHKKVWVDDDRRSRCALCQLQEAQPC